MRYGTTKDGTAVFTDDDITPVPPETQAEIETLLRDGGVFTAPIPGERMRYGTHYGTNAIFAASPKRHTEAVGAVADDVLRNLDEWDAPTCNGTERKRRRELRKEARRRVAELMVNHRPRIQADIKANPDAYGVFVGLLASWALSWAAGVVLRWLAKRIVEWWVRRKIDELIPREGT